MKYVLPIEGMHCAACAGTVERAIRATGLVDEVVVNFAAESASVTASAFSRAIVEAIEKAGYGVGSHSRLFACSSDPNNVPWSALEAEVLRISGVLRAVFNPATGLLRVDCIPSVTAESDLHAIAHRFGFVRRSPSSAPPALAEDRARFNLLLSLALGAAVMFLAMHHMFFHHALIEESLSGLLQLLLTIPIHFLCGWEFHRGLLRFLLRRQSADMNTLISLGTNAAFVASVVALVEGSHALYFESVATITLFVLFGRWLETRARRRARSAVDLLSTYRPSTATVEREGVDGVVATDDLAPGDIVLVGQGERVPADGVVVRGGSAVDESTMTGEGMPVDKVVGSRVVCGTLNLMTPFRFRVEKAGGETLLAKIADCLQLTQGTKPEIQRLADRISAIFVPVVLLIAAVTFAVWTILTGGDFSTALFHAVAVLVVSCPCALGLATPAAVVAGIGMAARSGILIREASVIERVGRITRILFDKTGTLTTGKPAIDGVHPINGFPADDLLRTTAVMEKGSAHPIGRAICATQSVPLPDPRSVEYLPGLGIAGVDDRGRTLQAGNGALMEIYDVDFREAGATGSTDRLRGKSVIYVAVDGRLAGTIVVIDPVRDGVADLLRSPSVAVRKTAMVSGDHIETARVVGGALGIREIHAGVMPQDKPEKVRQYRSRGDRVMMVGDGVNDAPALQEADVGVAVGSGTDVAIAAADVVIMRDDPRLIALLFEISRKTERIIRQNLFWAFGYNIVLIPVAAGTLVPWGVLLSPMAAAAAMSMSSLIVVGNALRLATSAK